MDVKVKLSIGYPSACHEDELEVPDDATDEDIEREVQEWAGNYIETSWHRMEEEDD